MIIEKATITANGITEIAVDPGEYIVQLGGENWNGATIQVHWDYGSGTQLYTGATFTVNGGGRFDNAAGKFAFITTGAGASTNVKVFLSRVITQTKEIH